MLVVLISPLVYGILEIAIVYLHRKLVGQAFIDFFHRSRRSLGYAMTTYQGALPCPNPDRLHALLISEQRVLTGPTTRQHLAMTAPTSRERPNSIIVCRTLDPS